jgi:hypothetical protein
MLANKPARVGCLKGIEHREALALVLNYYPCIAPLILEFTQTRMELSPVPVNPVTVELGLEKVVALTSMNARQTMVAAV